MYSIPMLPIDSFNFESWRACDIWTELGIACRQQDIIDHREVLRKYAIGYYPGEALWMRPKTGHMAVMFLVNDVMGWTHLRDIEFEEVFRVG